MSQSDYSFIFIKLKKPFVVQKTSFYLTFFFNIYCPKMSSFFDKPSTQWLLSRPQTSDPAMSLVMANIDTQRYKGMVSMERATEQRKMAALEEQQRSFYSQKQQQQQQLTRQQQQLSFNKQQLQQQQLTSQQTTVLGGNGVLFKSEFI